jgi:pimeloyl-ACP methyl ester carboxylesterase
MRSLAKRLRQAGYQPHRYSYATISDSFQQQIGRLESVVGQTAPDSPLHLVGHSLGGLVILAALQRNPHWQVKRVVLLGTPLNGSHTAQRLASWPGGRTLIGGSWPLPLQIGHTKQTTHVPIGMVAGNSGLGMGRVLGGLPQPHDGTVSVAETRHPLLTDHIDLPVSHTSMLWSAPVADACIDFLRAERFARPTFA